jgi:hypothetical protein
MPFFLLIPVISSSGGQTNGSQEETREGKEEKRGRENYRGLVDTYQRER